LSRDQGNDWTRRFSEMPHAPEIDVLVIGSGLAGAAAALAAARQGARVVMITKTDRPE